MLVVRPLMEESLRALWAKRCAAISYNCINERLPVSMVLHDFYFNNDTSIWSEYNQIVEREI